MTKQFLKQLWTTNSDVCGTRWRLEISSNLPTTPFASWAYIRLVCAELESPLQLKHLDEKYAYLSSERPTFTFSMVLPQILMVKFWMLGTLLMRP
jgi:hypothetical protein